MYNEISDWSDYWLSWLHVVADDVEHNFTETFIHSILVQL